MYTADEKRRLAEEIGRGETAPACPVCGKRCVLVKSEPRRDVAYVRNRLLVRCAKCARSLALELPRGGARHGVDRTAQGRGRASSASALVLVWLALCGLLTATPLRAGQDVLDHLAGVRAVAMGGAYWTAGGETGAIFHHPSLMSGEGFGGFFRYLDRSAPGSRDGSSDPAGATLLALTGSAAWWEGTVSVGVALLEYGVPHDDPSSSFARPGELTGRGTMAASEYVASVGFARRIMGVEVGVAVKTVGVRAGASRDATAAVDVGASVEVGFAAVVLSGQNLGPGVELGEGNRPLRKQVVLGAGADRTPLGPLDIGGAVQVAVDSRGTVAPGGGIEVAWWPVLRRVFTLRAGIARAHDGAGSGSAALSFGGGFAGDRVRLDYAYRHRLRDGSMVLDAPSHSVGLAFR